MFDIEKGTEKGEYNIMITRGDTGFIYIPLYDDDDEPYTPVEGDKLRFAVKKKYKDEECLILKDIPIQTQVLTIEPSDTKPLAFGKYVHDFEFTDSLGHVSTFVWGIFEVTEEVF